jgi:hypothetical protein
MKDYWRKSNHEEAEINTIYALKGALKGKKKYGHEETVPIDWVLDYIEETMADFERCYDEKYPEMK